MARPIKEGLDYLPLDVDFFENPKIEAIADEFECAGECIILRLFCRIYDNGAFVKCNALLTRPIAKRTGTSVETVEAVIERAVEYEIFDKEKFEQFGVLTSKGIQERYLFAKKRSKGVDIPEDFLLVDFDAIFSKNELLQQKPHLNGSYCNINSDSDGVIANFEKEERKERTKEKKEENKSLKVKESKVKKSINTADAVSRTREGTAAAGENDFCDSETYSDCVVELANAIEKRFNPSAMQAMPNTLRRTQALLQAIHTPGTDGNDTIQKAWDALKKLDTAEAIKSKKFNFSIQSFLNPDKFLKLLYGDYDNVVTKKTKTTPDLGVSFEELAKKGLYDHD